MDLLLIDIISLLDANVVVTDSEPGTFFLVSLALAVNSESSAGYVAADDYDDDGKEEEPRGGQKSNGAVRSWNSQARREAASVGPAATVERRRQYRSVIPGGSGAGVREAGQGKGGAGGHNSDRRELEEDIEDPAQAKVPNGYLCPLLVSCGVLHCLLRRFMYLAGKTCTEGLSLSK